MQMAEQTVQRTADGAAAVAAGAAGYSWLSAANELAQLIAAIVAIISGCFAIYFYWKKLKSPSK